MERYIWPSLRHSSQACLNYRLADCGKAIHRPCCFRRRLYGPPMAHHGPKSMLKHYLSP